MAIFSTNQVTQLYVVENADEFTAIKEADGSLYFQLKDSDKNQIRTDLVQNVSFAKATSATAMRHKFKKVKLTMTDADVILGQAYAINIHYFPFSVGIAQDEYAGYTVNTAATASKVLYELAKNLHRSARAQALINVKVLVGADEKDIHDVTEADTVSAIIIEERELAWHLGLSKSEFIGFVVQAYPIIKDSIEYDWATITDETASQTAYLGNGRITAEMEWFCLGERGDIYRYSSWPYIIPTTYLVDVAKEYDYITIHFAYTGSNHGVQKSEKDLVFVMPVTGTTDHTLASSILTKINAVAGTDFLKKPEDW